MFEYKSPTRVDRCQVRTLPLGYLPSWRVLNTPFRSGWLGDTFINSDGAEAALCDDRSGFLRGCQLCLIPSHIERLIIHRGDVAHVEGFQKLFDYLDRDPTADGLRQLVVNYFNDTPYLQPHLYAPLSTSSFHPILMWHIT